SLPETPTLLLDYPQSLQRVMSVLPVAGISQSCEVGRRDIWMARLQRCLRGSRKRLRLGIDRCRTLQIGEGARGVLRSLRCKAGRTAQAILLGRVDRHLRQIVEIRRGLVVAADAKQRVGERFADPTFHGATRLGLA